MKKKVKLERLHIVLIILLLLCLFHMPYGFYMLVRFIAMVAFAVLAYQYWNSGKKQYAIVFGTLALLFQPFAKIALGRGMWNLVDVVVAIWLAIILLT